MEVLNFQKEAGEASRLRLVEDSISPNDFPAIGKQFVNYVFFRVNPEWRKLSSSEKKAYKDEFQQVFDNFRQDLLLFSYSLVGFDSKADLMFWRIGDALDTLQDMTTKLYRTNLGSYLETADNYLSVTKKKAFVTESAEDQYHVNAGEKKYHFIYPCSGCGEFSTRSDSDNESLIEENFMVGKRFPNIKIHMTRAFGFSDREFIISFETDEPKDFLALSEELRETPVGKFRLRGMPIYTCRQRPLMDCLDALG
ncbi:MAG TPA: hypothetical protein DEA22_01750 [Blastocatellia bacterium]|nr:hypothetical protein [Blastocatellia bacterium]